MWGYNTGRAVIGLYNEVIVLRMYRRGKTHIHRAFTHTNNGALCGQFGGWPLASLGACLVCS
jgi:hypothetical protein